MVLEVAASSGGARANTRWVCLPCECIKFYRMSVNMVKI